ncbi:tetratricopeptide repeat protein [Oceanispirochaeta crateris]|uniref:Tetratricopeptide repeat protein n=1 Tax=Oceanispirochaeta crateris TaxID=2518645 RepID=A0A5C1QIH5_9SPIO|nr:tetratricopeptide repeat protein [Oceanispirochaeta crateris]QEN07965.1 tetratricopeptide repeat protein [Oceanispirochaeta crateris]
MFKDKLSLDELTKGLSVVPDEDGLNEISELSKRGYQLLKENLTERARESFEKILSIDDVNNYALVGMGDCYRKERNFREAVIYYQRCLATHPGNNYALFGLADCYKAMNQYNRAIDIWEEYLLHDDRNITVLTRIADAYRKVRNFKRSFEIYQKVLTMEENNSYAIIGLGHLYYDFKEYKDALHYWERMLEINRGHVDIRVLTSLGNCHRKLKTFSEGVPFFLEALKLQPHNFYALFGLADCYRGMNQQEKSLVYWNKILDLDHKNKVILTRAGDAYRSMGDLENAEEYYRKALNIEFDTYAILGLAMINKKKGHFQDAITSLKDLISNDPRNYRLYLEAADCYEGLGDTEEALGVLALFLNTGIRNNTVIERIMELKNKIQS